MKKTILPYAAAALMIAALAPATARADAAENYGHACASCHGKDGVGKTKAGKKVGVKDLTSAEVQKGFTDAAAFKDLKEGLKGDDGSDKMKPFAAKFSDDEIKALVTYVRAFAK